MKLGESAGVLPLAGRSDLYDHIREALHQALSDTLNRLASPDTLDALLAQVAARRRSEPSSEPLAARETLTARELEILKCIANGLSNKAIARQLGLSLHTVKRHVANILGKLGVGSRVQAATWLRAHH